MRQSFSSGPCRRISHLLLCDVKPNHLLKLVRPRHQEVLFTAAKPHIYDGVPFLNSCCAKDFKAQSLLAFFVCRPPGDTKTIIQKFLFLSELLK